MVQLRQDSLFPRTPPTRRWPRARRGRRSANASYELPSLDSSPSPPARGFSPRNSILKSESAEEGTRVTQVVPPPSSRTRRVGRRRVGIRPRVDATDYERRTASEAATAEERLAGRPTVRRGWRQPSGHPTGSRRPRRPSQIG